MRRDEVQAKIDIKLGPFMLFPLHLDAKEVRCDGQLFGEAAGDYPAAASVSLHSVPDPDGRWPDYGRDRGRIICTTLRDHRYWIATSGSFDAWFRGCSRNTRQSLGRKVKKLEQALGHPLDVRAYRTAAELAAFHPPARAISKTTYHERYVGRGLPDTAAFRAEMMARAERGLCHGSILFHGERPISYFYCERHARRSEPVHFGFDTDYARLSIGTVHWLLLIKEAFADPACDVVDFGLGSFQYKDSFSTDRAPCANVLLVRSTLRNWSAINLYRLMRWVSCRSVGAIEALGLKARLRRLLRGT